MVKQYKTKQQVIVTTSLIWSVKTLSATTTKTKAKKHPLQLTLNEMKKK